MLDKNYKYKKNTLDEITEELIFEAACTTMTSGFTSIAPLGFNGDTFILYEGVKEEGNNTTRCSQISLRNYCGILELLITDKEGGFIIYNQLDGLTAEEIVKEYYRQFLTVKHLIDKKIERAFQEAKFVKPVSELIEESVGFKILEKLKEK